MNKVTKQAFDQSRVAQTAAIMSVPGQPGNDSQPGAYHADYFNALGELIGQCRYPQLAKPELATYFLKERA